MMIGVPCTEPFIRQVIWGHGWVKAAQVKREVAPITTEQIAISTTGLTEIIINVLEYVRKQSRVQNIDDVYLSLAGGWSGAMAGSTC
jgi:hypothetical protein